MSQQSLANYLFGLNSVDNTWGLWVNPKNVDEFRIGQYCFDNGGMLDEWVNVGSLDSLTSDRIEYAGYDSDYLDYEWAVNKVEEIKSVLTLMG